jgi:hypothetical protein
MEESMQTLAKTYTELDALVKVFNQGKLEIMIIEGTAGVGKSSIVKKNLPSDGHLWLEGRVSAFNFYKSLQEKADLPVYLDDVDGLLGNKDSINILKCVCQTESKKTVSWHTNANKDDEKSFETTSKVLVITNDWRTLNKHVDAVDDRGLLVRFEPSAEEVHNHIKGFFDQEVYNFIGEHLNLIREPSMRLYRTASQLKNLDWKGMLLESFKIKKESWICVLKLRAVHVSDNQKSLLFAQETGLDPRTYWRIKKELKKRGIAF